VVVFGYYWIFLRFIFEDFDTLSTPWKWISALSYAIGESYKNVIFLLVFYLMFGSLPRRAYYLGCFGMVFPLVLFLSAQAAGTWTVAWKGLLQNISILVDIMLLSMYAWVATGPAAGHPSSSASVSPVPSERRVSAFQHRYRYYVCQRMCVCVCVCS